MAVRSARGDIDRLLIHPLGRFTSLLRKLGGARMAMMEFLFFPFLGLGLFAIQIGRGIAPALFALAMLLTYSVVMGVVYATLNS